MEKSKGDYDRYIMHLTVAEFKNLYREMTQAKRYEYGIKGLAKVLGCARSTAYSIKASGILDPAITQNGKIIVIDVDYALALFRHHEQLELNKKMNSSE